MTTTPERALELAEYFDLDRGHGICPTPAIVHDPDSAEIAAILRHYAEILPKWQAVLNAEPVKTTCFGTQLIIKPAP